MMSKSTCFVYTYLFSRLQEHEYFGFEVMLDKEPQSIKFIM